MDLRKRKDTGYTWSILRGLVNASPAARNPYLASLSAVVGYTGVGMAIVHVQLHIQYIHRRPYVCASHRHTYT